AERAEEEGGQQAERGEGNMRLATVGMVGLALVLPCAAPRAADQPPAVSAPQEAADAPYDPAGRRDPFRPPKATSATARRGSRGPSSRTTRGSGTSSRRERASDPTAASSTTSSAGGCGFARTTSTSTGSTIRPTWRWSSRLPRGGSDEGFTVGRRAAGARALRDAASVGAGGRIERLPGGRPGGGACAAGRRAHGGRAQGRGAHRARRARGERGLGQARRHRA